MGLGLVPGPQPLVRNQPLMEPTAQRLPPSQPAVIGGTTDLWTQRLPDAHV